ncbi:hypothetical protein MNBD_GAMMA01-563 [hydrothermal vent metagenome]|uniref:Sirohydrochlorin cobaltochelatase n=1 Tax=hydrothermal vent metagenome TaxID=652676 RepID=A0A3B0UU88_9ZZZZ
MYKYKIFIILLSLLGYTNITVAAKTPDTGVLILAHGGKHESWDKAVKHASNKVQKDYLVEVAFGMANPVSMQQAINNLEKQGAKKIVVVPLFISSHSPIIRQNEYLLGFRDELADPPMMMHHGHGSDAMTDMEIKPLTINAKIFLTNALDSHPLVTNIIYDRIKKLSKKPKNETIIILAHGPNSEADNKNWIKEINSISEQIREKNNYKQIFGLTVRDDANEEVYEQAKEHLRTLVYQAGKSSDVIVVPLLLSQGGIEQGYVKRLKGLNYKWSGETLLPHKNITKFIQASVKYALEKESSNRSVTTR